MKPSNLLLKNNPGSLPTILVSDFGESEVMNEHDLHERTGATGTLEFMPPELLSQDEYGKYSGEHSPKAVIFLNNNKDMWSLGIILYFLCYSRVPWSQTENTEVLTKEILCFDKIVFPDGGERVSPVFCSIMSRLLVKDSRKRPTSGALLKEIESLRSPASVSTSRMISLSRETL